MRNIIRSLFESPKFSKAIEGVKLITIQGFAQFAVQILGFLSGIVIIRVFSTKEYALYTIANTMLGAMVVLADSGVSTGVMAHGAKHWQDKKELGKVLVTGLNLRKKFAVVIFIIVIPVLIYLLNRNGATLLSSLLIALSLIPAFLSDLSDRLLEIPAKLLQDLGRLQKNQLWSAFGRFSMTILLVFIFPWTYIALIATGIPRIWANVRLRKISAEHSDLTQGSDPIIKKDILAMVTRLLPGVVYYCFSGQITIWIMSVFGTSSAMAKIGALGRISMMLNFLSILFNTIIMPRFARMPNQSHLLLKRLNKVIIGLISLCLFIIFFVHIFSTELLWVLGKNYIHLEYELTLIIVGACVGFIAGSVFNLALSKGWTINPILLISVSLSAIVLGVFFINVSSLRGVLFFNIFIATIELLMHFIHIMYRIIKLKKVDSY